jgi:predicted metal-dependent enzyme (double-stranded beta helix superfamily)
MTAGRTTLDASALLASPVARFVSDVDAIRRRPIAPRTIARLVGIRLAPLVADGSWLEARHRESAADRYRQHILYVARDGGFSVVSLVWLPGQKTPIHDHVAWCVVGVLEGVERETRYRLHQADGERFLARRFDRTARRGETGYIVPPDEDIHQVTNAGDGIAISIHVYGANIRELGTSINHTFDDLPIRDRAAGAPVSWRSS